MAPQVGKSTVKYVTYHIKRGSPHSAFTAGHFVLFGGFNPRSAVLAECGRRFFLRKKKSSTYGANAECNFIYKKDVRAKVALVVHVGVPGGPLIRFFKKHMFL